MGSRLSVYAGLGLLIGVTAAGALQVGFNVLRFLIQPDWLAGGGGAVLIALLGLAIAAIVGFGFAEGVRRALGCRRAGWLIPATATGLLLDPYFLAEFGWTGPARMQWAARALASALPAFALLPLLPRTGQLRRIYAGLAGLAVIVFAALPRFALVPALGGELDLAAMSPLYLLVYAKGLALLTLAAALSLLLETPAARSTA